MIEQGKGKIQQSKIASKYRTLLKSVLTNIKKEELKAIRKALDLAIEASGQRADFLGEPHVFFTMAIATTVVKEIGLGYRSILSSLLYPYRDFEKLSLRNIESEFGKDVAVIVNDLRKIIAYDSHTNPIQADNYRQLLITVSSDVRVILIKLAEKLYIMRHLHRYSKEDQLKLAIDVSNLYAPLAHRLGLYNMKTEMEDIALRYREPEVYKSIEESLRNTTQRRNRFIKKFVEPIEEELKKQGFSFEIKGRTKSIYSIWNKMRKQEVEFDEIYDIFAIRIILTDTMKDEKSDCWSVYSIVTNIYQPNPRRLRDWISVPKSNGYESLHTTVVVPGGKWVEVQIRTQRMNDIAEKGLAAHWKYKGGKEDRKMEDWISRIREIIESSAGDVSDDQDQVNYNLYEDEVFVFTPKGDLKKLPQGASVLDFAFDIHSDIGATCTGARVNNKNVPIRYVLRNGDEVEILTNKNQKPKMDWLEFVVTSKARSKIRQILRDDKYKEAEHGKELLKRRLKNWKINFSDELINNLMKHYKVPKAIDLYFYIGLGKYDITEIRDVLNGYHDKKDQEKTPPQKSKPVYTPNAPATITEEKKPDKWEDYLIIDSKIENVDYKLAKCCNPVMGDEIFGFVTVSEGIKIHRISCPNAQQLMLKYPYRVLHSKWTSADNKTLFETVIMLKGKDDMGLVNNISSIITKDLRVNMRSISFDSQNGLFTGKIKLLIKDIEHLHSLMDKLANVKGVEEVLRYDDYSSE